MAYDSHIIPLVYKDVSSMKTDSILKRGMIVKTLGYFYEGDGGSSYYRIRERFDNEKEIDGYVIFLESISESDSNLCAEYLPQDNAINIVQFGANGDGITNDTKNIQTAIRIAKELKFDRGKKYLITEPIKITDNIKIDLNGSKLILNTPIEIDMSESENIDFYTDKNLSIVIENGEIIKTTEGSLLSVVNNNIPIYIKDIKFTSPNTAIRFLDSKKNVYVDNCTFEMDGSNQSPDIRLIGNTDLIIPDMYEENRSTIYIEKNVKASIKNSKFYNITVGIYNKSENLLIEHLEVSNNETNYNNRIFLYSECDCNLREVNITNIPIICRIGGLKNPNIVLDNFDVGYDYGLTNKSIGYIFYYDNIDIEYTDIKTVLRNSTIMVPDGLRIVFNNLNDGINKCNDGNNIENVESVAFDSSLITSMLLESSEMNHVMFRHPFIYPEKTSIGFVKIRPYIYFENIIHDYRTKISPKKGKNGSPYILSNPVVPAPDGTMGYYSFDIMNVNKAGDGITFLFKNGINYSNFIYVKMKTVTAQGPDGVFRLTAKTSNKNYSDMIYMFKPSLGNINEFDIRHSGVDIELIIPVFDCETEDLELSIEKVSDSPSGSSQGRIQFSRIYVVPVDESYIPMFVYESIESVYNFMHELITDIDSSDYSACVQQRNGKFIQHDVKKTDVIITSVPCLPHDSYYDTYIENDRGIIKPEIRNSSRLICNLKDYDRNYFKLLPQPYGFSISLNSNVTTETFKNVPSSIEISLIGKEYETIQDSTCYLSASILIIEKDNDTDGDIIIRIDDQIEYILKNDGTKRKSFRLPSGNHTFKVSIKFNKPIQDLYRYTKKMYVKNFFVTDNESADIFNIIGRFDETYQIPIYKNGFIGITPIEEGMSNSILSVARRGQIDVAYPVSSSSLYQEYENYKQNNSPTNITIINDNYKLEIGDQVNIPVDFTPASSLDTFITWNSSDIKVATVTNGIVNGLSSGEVIITASYNKLKTTTKINVQRFLKGIEFGEYPKVVNNGDVNMLPIIFEPVDYTEELTPIYTVQNPNIFAIDSKGYVIAKGLGVSTISVQYGEFKITTDPIQVISEIRGIYIISNNSYFNGEIAVNNTELFTVKFNPEDTTDDRTTTWSIANGSENAEIISVTEDTQSCRVRGKQSGAVVLKAICGRYQAEYSLNIGIPLTGIMVDRTMLSIDRGLTDQVQVIKSPLNTTDIRNAHWTSSDPSIASVNEESGLITAEDIGNTIITAAIGNFKASTNVTVFASLKGISLNKKSIQFTDKNQKESLNVIFDPVDTTDSKIINWSIDNPGIAEIDNGEITSKRNGSTLVRASVGKFTSVCELNVNIRDPHYESDIFDDEISIVKEKLNNITQSSSNIVFITDTMYHTMNVYENDENVRGLIHTANIVEISKYANADMILHGGNMCMDGYNLDSFSEKIAEMYSILDKSSTRPNFLHGNLDYNDTYYSTNPDTSVVLSPSDKNELTPNIEDEYNAGFFYKDIADKKMRIICLNSHDTYKLDASGKKLYDRVIVFGYSSSQVLWLQSTLLSTPDDYTVLVFTHAPIDSEFYTTKNAGINASIVEKMFEAFVNGTSYAETSTRENFSVSVDVNFMRPHNLVGIISGYVGYDMYLKKNGLNHFTVSSSLTTTPDEQSISRLTSLVSNLKTYGYDCEGSYALPRTIETVNEDAFDIVSVDTISRKIKFTRFGSGEDREYNY